MLIVYDPLNRHWSLAQIKVTLSHPTPYTCSRIKFMESKVIVEASEEA